MKIGIDARMYGPKQAGLGRYVEQLVLGLAEFDKENQYIIYVRTYPASAGPRLEAVAKYEFTKKELPSNFKVVRTDMPWYSWQEQIKFKKIIDKEQVDLMHFPHWNAPLFYNKPFVVTIHDLIMYHYPRQEASTRGPVVYWLKDMAHRLVLRHAVRKAKHIIVTSEFTKRDVHETLKAPLEKMTVVYQAPFERYNNQETNKFQISNFKFQINKPYVLYVGNAYPHKNLEGLLKAWKIFCEKYGDEYQLVLVGKKNFFYERLLNNPTLPSPRRGGNIAFTDFVSDEELANLYQNASLYVFPSLYEGFGLPPLEAMTYGVPVTSSNASCLPEVLGEGALYFDPENYEQMADVIHCGLTDENIRLELREKARKELKRYSRERMVKQSLQVYKCVSME